MVKVAVRYDFRARWAVDGPHNSRIGLALVMQDSAARLYILDPTELEAFEIGAWLMAILAFPGSDEAEADARREAAEAWRADAVRVSCAADRSRTQEFHDHLPVSAQSGVKPVVDFKTAKKNLIFSI